MSQKLFIFKLLAVAVTVFLLLGYVIYPLGQLLVVGSSQSGVINLLIRKQILSACLNSILLSIVSVIGSSIIGVYFAYAFHFEKIRLKTVFSSLILMPIAVPPIVGVMAYLFLLGDNGLLAMLGWHDFAFSGFWAIAVIHLYSFYPLFYIFTSNALKSMDSSVIEASYAAGASKFRTFFEVILPQLRISLVSASLLTFMASMASFSAPFIFGGSKRFLTTEIYYSKINGDTALSAVLSLLLAAISIGSLIFFKLYSKRLPKSAKNKGTTKRNALAAYRRSSLATNIVTVFFIILTLLPIISLFLISIMPNNGIMEERLPHRFSVENYSALFANEDLGGPFMHSLAISSVAVGMTVLLGLSIAHITRGRHNLFKFLMEATASIPYGIPGTVIAICLILSFNQSCLFAFNYILAGTFWILPVAYTIRNLPIITQAIKAGLHSIDASVEEASDALGATSLKTWRSITLPLMVPSIIDGSLLVFINCFGEFVATVLLYNYSTKTVPIEIYAQMRMFNNGTAAAFGIVLFIIVVSIVFLTRKLISQQLSQG